MADELSGLYIDRGPVRLKRELDTWLTANLRLPTAALQPQQQYEALVDELAPQYGQDPMLVKAMIQAESAWNPQAVSPKGAKGIAQFMDGTARRFGVTDPFDPTQAIPGMLKYLKTLSDEFKDPVKVVAAYNAGEGAVRQYGGVPPYAETMKYVQKVIYGVQPESYTSKGEGVGPLASPAETQAMRQALPYTSKRPQEPSAPQPMPEAQMLDATLPSLAEPGMLEMSQAARQARTYTSRGEGMGPETFPAARRFNPYMPGQALESGLEEPTVQRVAPRIMEGVFGTLAGVSALPMTAGRLLGLSEREAETIFPQSAGLRNAFQELAQTFDPTGQEENIVDRFAQTVGQQIVFFGSGAAVARGIAGINEFAPAIGRALGAGTAAVQEAGMEAQQTLDALTPIVGNEEAARRANTVFWRNVAVLGLTNKLGVFRQSQMPALLKIGTAAAMEGFQEVVQYDQGRRQFWVDARHPLANQLQALGWKRHAQQVYQPFDIADAAEAGAIGAIIGGGARIVRDAAGREVLSREAEQRVVKGLETLAQRTAQLRPQAADPAPQAVSDEQQGLNVIRERIKGIDDSKVRDAEGRLIRMYHGTGAAFESFDPSQAHEFRYLGRGLYFTDTPTVASRYAEQQTPSERAGPNVRPVYLDIKHPFDTTDTAAMEVFLTEHGAELGPATDTVGTLIPMYHRVFLGMRKAVEEIKSPNDFNSFLQGQGYDGIRHFGAEDGDVYIAFSPEQVIPSFELEAHPWFSSVLAYAGRPSEAQLQETAAVDAAELSRSSSMRTITDYVHGTTEANAALIQQHGFSTSPLPVQRQYDYSVAGPGALYFAKPGPGGFLDPAWARRSLALEYATSVPVTVQGNIITLRSAEDADRFAKRFGFADMSRMERELFVDKLQSEEMTPEEFIEDQRTAQAIVDAIRQEGIDGIEITFPQALVPEAPFGGNQLIIWNPTVVQQGTTPAVSGSLGIGPSFLRGQAGAIRPLRGMNIFPQNPSPPPKRPPTIGAGATGLERGNFRDEHGRWRIPLADIPSIELELQDFIRQQGGIRLEGEELHGELAALISRRETGVGGLQNNVSGMRLQEIAEKARELRFTTAPDKMAFLEALDRSMNQGHLVYSPYATGHIPLLQNPTLAGLYQDLVTLAETSQEQIQEQRRGVRPRPMVHQQGREMIAQGQMTRQDIKDMLPGMSLNDETASAMVQLMGQMAGDIAEVARQYVNAQTNPGDGSQSEQDFLTGFALLAGIQPQRLGAIAEAGRSLGILNDPLSPVNRMLNELVQMIPKTPGMNSRTLAEKYLSLYDSMGGAEAIKYGVKALTPGYGGMLLELYYQGMLSNPKTWLTNGVSNLTVAGWALPVRLMSGMVSQYAPQVTTPEVNLGPLHFRSLQLGGSGEIGLMETAAYAYGMQYMVQTAWQMSREAFLQGQGSFGETIPGVMESVGYRKTVGPAMTATNLQANGFPMDPNSPFGKLADFWFEWVGLSLLPPGLPTGGRLGTKVMESTDEFFKFLNYGGELAALAYRDAVQKQTYDPNASFADNMARILSNPLPDEMHRAAASHAVIQTFQNELTGGIGRLGSAIQSWNLDVPGFGEFPAGRVILPFLHVAVNIPRYAMEHSPVGLFFKTVRDDLAAGGARADMAQGKMLMGTLTMATFALMASSGLITGRGPDDKEMKDAMVRVGWQPYSLFVPWLGDKGGYISLRAFDPIVGQHAGIMADIVENYADQRQDVYEKVILGPIFAAVSNIGSRSWMQGMGEFFDIFSPRSRREFEGESAMEGLRGFVRGRLSALTPSVWSVLEKALDPATQVAWGMTDGWLAKIPVVAEATLPHYRNKWGDKRQLGWGWSPSWLNWVEGFTEAINPLKVTTLVSNPLDRRLVADQIRLGMPTKSWGMRGPEDVTGTGAEAAFAAAEATNPAAAKSLVLDPKQYEKYVALAANNLEAISELGLAVNPDAVRQLRLEVGGFAGQRLPNETPGDLYSVLLWATTTKAYQEGNPGPDGGRDYLVRRIDSKYREFGRTQLLANDEALRQQYLTAGALRELQRTPPRQQEQMRRLQERTLQREDQRLRVGGP